MAKTANACEFQRIEPTGGYFLAGPDGQLEPILYNLISLPQTGYITMPLVGYQQLAKRRLLSGRGAVVLLAIMALTVSLANRVPHAVSVHQATAAHSSPFTAKIQHRDQDASRWVAPVATFTLLWASEPAISLGANEEFPVRLQGNSLRNRPPPVS
jgi:hypothetical protein